MAGTKKEPRVVLAAAAHPDDIEFAFAGTLLLLKEAGCSIHMWNLANGCCGSMTKSREEIARIRSEEARNSAALAGATYYEPLFNDLEIFYDKASLAAVSSVVRAVRPDILLTHSPADYMEDHQNVCRLVTMAAFSREIPNFQSDPPQPPSHQHLRIYHAAPHGLRCGMGNIFHPDLIVDISSVQERKQQMLACHRSQKDWLEATQGIGAYLEEMEEMGHHIAKWGQGISFAEGWKKHSHLGFCPPDFDPLSQVLGSFVQLVIPHVTSTK